MSVYRAMLSDKEGKRTWRTRDHAWRGGRGIVRIEKARVWARV